MLKNYLKIALRNLLKYKAFSFINVFGLAMSMAVCLLVILIAADQLGYDQFHQNRDRIYRINTQERGGGFKTASSALPLGAKLKEGYGGVEAAASLARGLGGDVFFGEQVATGAGYFADGQLFDILDFKLVKGNPATALANPFSLVISEAMAAQLFGQADPLGRVVRFNDRGISPVALEAGNRETEYGEFTITGVLANPPGKTHLPFQVLASLSTLPRLQADKKISQVSEGWANVWDCYTYVRLAPGQTQADLQRQLDQLALAQYPEAGANKYGLVAQPLGQLTPSEPIGNMTSLTVPSQVLWVLAVLGLVVMLSACLNYTNLSVARALTRAREVGIRKVAGATRAQVFGQFLAEAVVFATVALGLSIGILALLKLAFTGLWLNRYLQITFDQGAYIYLIYLAFAGLVGVVAGALPAYYLSAFSPLQVLKNLGGAKLFRRLTLRRVLLVVQFCISLVFIITATLLYFQVDYLFRADYGFEKDNIVNIKLYRTDNLARFTQAIGGLPQVRDFTACSFMPATGTTMGTTLYKTAPSADSLQISFVDVDARFIDFLGLKLLAGENFPAQPPAKGEQYVVLNQKAAKDLGWGSPAEAIGQPLLIDGNNVVVRGVVKDFQHRELVSQIGPFVLRHRADNWFQVNVKVSGPAAMATVAELERQWRRVNPNTKFDYAFFDQQLLFTHFMLGDVAKVVGLLAILAVVIACLGLLGMAAYTAQARTKEIGVRKVLGASVPQVAGLLARNFLYLLGIAIVVATPLAYVMNNLWLDFFANRITFGPGILGLGIGLMLAISLLTVFSQTWRAARANPVDSLRSE
jgi:putative ABC transport system permease protein